jgi:hypothetical protein
MFAFFPLSLSAGTGGDSFPNDNKCLTFAHESRGKAKSLLSKTASNRPVNQTHYLSPAGNFKIHYDESGDHAVDPTDANHNGVPDYVDSVAYYFELAYEVYVNQIGYNSPIPDNGKAGPEYDVYISDQGNALGAYGWTDTETRILPTKAFPRYYSYIVIDNDYSPTDSSEDAHGNKTRSYYTTGIDGMKITAVHEFHHAIQYTYGLPYPSVSTIGEMTSTFMEYRFFPDVHDYYQYVKSLFEHITRYPFGTGDPYTGYRYSIFGHYLYKNHGDKILLRTWELVEDGQNAYAALDSALHEQGSDITTAWKEFTPWLYYTGERAIEGKYFTDAADFPLLTPADSKTIGDPATLISGGMDVFEQRMISVTNPYRCGRTPDRIDVLIANTDRDALIKEYNKLSDFTFACTKLHQDGFEKAGNYYYKFEGDSELLFDYVYYSEGESSQKIDYAFPNPFDPERYEVLYLPLPVDEPQYNRSTDFEIYDPDMNLIYRGSAYIETRGEHFVLAWDDIPREIENGVYLYKIPSIETCDGGMGSHFGKFAILRK